MIVKKPTRFRLESRFDVTGPEARKSMKVIETDVDDDEEKVRTETRFIVHRQVLGHAAPEEVDCELSVALTSPVKDAEEPVIFSFEAGLGCRRPRV